jgi:hypothetical protein
MVCCFIVRYKTGHIEHKVRSTSKFTGWNANMPQEEVVSITACKEQRIHKKKVKNISKLLRLFKWLCDSSMFSPSPSQYSHPQWHDRTILIFFSVIGERPKDKVGLKLWPWATIPHQQILISLPFFDKKKPRKSKLKGMFIHKNLLGHNFDVNTKDASSNTNTHSPTTNKTI